ncbi:hypothetical protein EYF80_034997 [Liparis tanakae]|uniref:Uncharacterized protein n=1 Tax=Liparis tanakae TaxID=230148 RepID=A0A4Z2GNE3_9TELE|nr:hypothetical protein EYF80_034997 [Liparis tanakae]
MTWYGSQKMPNVTTMARMRFSLRTVRRNLVCLRRRRMRTSSLSSLTSRNTSEGMEMTITSTHSPTTTLLTTLGVIRVEIFRWNTTTTSRCTLISVIRKMEAYMLVLHR